MSLQTKLASLTQGMELGVFPDKHSVREGVWRDARNIRFTEQGAQPIRGWWSKMTDVGNTALALLPSLRGGFVSQIGNSFRGIIGNYNRVYLLEFDSWEQIELTQLDTAGGLRYKTSSAPAAYWSVVPWGSFFVLTSAGGVFRKWSEGGGIEALTLTELNPPRLLTVDPAHVLAYNTPNAPMGVFWCSADDIDEWIPAANNSAGDFIIREFTSPITAAIKLNTATAVFTESQMALVNYVGAPYFYGYQMVSSTLAGVYGPGAVATTGDRVYGVGRNGFFVSDGVETQQIGRQSVWETFKRELNPNAADLIHAYHDANNKEIVFWYPEGDSPEPNKAIVFQYLTGAWTFFQADRSGSIGPGVYPHPIGFHPDGTIYFHEIGMDDIRFGYVAGATTSSPIERWIESKPLTFSTEEADLEMRYKFITGIQFHFTDYEGVTMQIKVGHQTSLYDTPEYWSNAYSYDVAYPLMSVHYGVIRIEESRPTGVWTLQGMDIFGSVGGMAR